MGIILYIFLINKINIFKYLFSICLIILNRKSKSEKKEEQDLLKAKKTISEVNPTQVTTNSTNNTTTEDNYMMPVSMFGESNPFDDFGDWETGIEITDKDFDFFDDNVI